MRMSVDGACRRNGDQDATATAAVIIHLPDGEEDETWVKHFPDNPHLTSQAAQLTAVVFALELALDIERRNSHIGVPYMRITVMTDSMYAIGCLTEWYHDWVHNGWADGAGRPVANKNLIQEALYLKIEIEENGDVIFQLIQEAQNFAAACAVDDALNTVYSF